MFYGFVGTAIVGGLIAYTLRPSQFDNMENTMVHGGGGWPYLFFILTCLSAYIVVVAVPIFLGVAYLTQRLLASRCPDYAAIYELGLAMTHLAARGAMVGDLENRNNAIRHLEAMPLSLF